MHRTIADALGVSQADVAVMDARMSGPDTSLNAPVSDGEGSSDRQDFLVDAAPLQDETVGEAVDGARRTAWLGKALTVLNERELQIVRERRLTEGDGATLEALGATLGISKERVRQIEARALEKLKVALLAAEADRGSFVGH